MQRWAALLRGINVGRSPRIAMPALRELAAGLGWRDVVTHLQSGNLVFGADAAPPDGADVLAGTLERAVAGRFEVAPRVVVLTGAELTALAAANPYPAEAAADPRSVHVVVLRVSPAAGVRTGRAVAERVAGALAAESGRGGPDGAAQAGGAVWLHTPDGAGRSRLFAALTGPASFGPDVVSTARNAATLAALVGLLDRDG